MKTSNKPRSAVGASPSPPALPPAGAHVECLDCGEDIKRGYCEHCADNAYGDAASKEMAEVAAPGQIRDWTARARLLYGYPPETLAALERCAQELEDGIG